MGKSTESLSDAQLLLLLKEHLSYNPETGIITRIKLLPFDYNGNKVGDTISFKDKKGYIIFKFKGKALKAHRIAWFMYYGVMPKGGIDHKNGIKHDNRISNLRCSTQLQNMQNEVRARVTNKSGLIGVSFNKVRNGYIAQICINGKKKWLGCFDNPTDAHNEYLKAKRTYHEFCTI